jgi:hypothetical protein
VQKVHPPTPLRFVLCAANVLLLGVAIHAQQMADPSFNSSVQRPAYTRTHPTVVIDEAHSNFHTAEGRYKPFAELLRSDGYRVLSGTKRFEKGSLKGVHVLVISNAQAPDATDDFSGPAFTEQECDVVRDWVRAGGSLLLIADHTPYGGAAENLGKRFGVGMGKGFVLDLANSFDLANSEANPTLLIFSRENGLLGDHPLLRGRNPSEQVQRVVAFTGQSLGLPEGANALLKLGPSAYESPSQKELGAALGMDSKEGPAQKTITAHARPVGGRAQGIAMKFGKGRLVVFGEAAMFSAQVIRFKEGEQQREFKMGMNVPGSDDRQLALNVLHWLSGLLK